jgi:hypothetical protein
VLISQFISIEEQIASFAIAVRVGKWKPKRRTHFRVRLKRGVYRLAENRPGLGLADYV